jgi:peptidoglycan/LPS O-acetylase OafA/YrhL
MSAPTKVTGASPFHIPSLDGIRAVAFMIVFVAHAGLNKIVPGGFGVTVFFFLSGYLITTLMRVEYEEHGTVSLKQFYLRRVLRILPPFYLVLAISTALSVAGLLAHGIDPLAIAAQTFHGANYWIIENGYDGLPQGTGVFWSLAVEEHFYLVFPLIFLALHNLIKTPPREAVFLYGLCALILLWRCVLVYGVHSTQDRTYVGSDTRFDSILYGCALAIRGNPMLDGASSCSDRTWKWLFLPGALATLAFTFVYREPAFRETFRYSLQGIALTPIFVCAMRFPNWSVFRWLNGKIVNFVGVLSYSLYLVHHVIIDAIGHHVAMHPVLRAVVALAASLALSYAIYIVIEKPCAKLRKRLSRRAVLHVAPRPTPPVPAVAAGSSAFDSHAC